MRTRRCSEQGAGCLPNLDPGQNASSLCMQGTCASHTYHLLTRIQRVHRVVRVAPLGELCSWSDSQALQVNYYDIMRHIALLPEEQALRWCLWSSFCLLQSPQRGPLIDPVHLICVKQIGVSHMTPIHVQVEGWRSLNLGCIDLLSCTSLPATLHNLTSQISALSTNLKILR